MNDDEQKQKFREIHGLPNNSPLGMHVVTDLEAALAGKRKREEALKQRLEEYKRRAQEQKHKNQLPAIPPTDFDDVDG